MIIITVEPVFVIAAFLCAVSCLSDINTEIFSNGTGDFRLEVLSSEQNSTNGTDVNATALAQNLEKPKSENFEEEYVTMVDYGENGSLSNLKPSSSNPNDETNITESIGAQNITDPDFSSDFNSTATVQGLEDLEGTKGDGSNDTFVVDHGENGQVQSSSSAGERNASAEQEFHELTLANSDVADFNSTALVQNMKQRNGTDTTEENLENASINDYGDDTTVSNTTPEVYTEDTTWTSTINTNETVELCNPYGNTTYDSYTTNETNYCGCTDDRYCLRKCCQAGYYHRRVEDLDNNFFESICIKNHTSVPFNLTVYDGYEPRFQWTNFTVGMLRCNRTTRRQYFKMGNAAAWMKYYVQANGTLYYPKSPFRFYDRSRFCVDEGEGLSVFLCYSPERQEVVVERFVTAAGMIISMPFLLCTFLVYLILPESNIHRKSLMFYVMTLFLGYMILVGVQLNDSNIPDLFCKTLGYGIIFFFISSFFWMNVMCVDMWLTFSGLRGFKGQRSSEMKRFLIYCAYALGTPFILLLIVFLVNTYGDPKSIFHPHLGISRCFLDDGYPNLFYFYLPMAIIIAINILMFVMTALRIQKVKKETSMLKHSDNKRHSFEEDKQKFNLYVKLLFAMGINWIMEVISWAVGWAIPSTSTYVWYITDFANAAYGLFIFFIFVFKHKTWVSLKKRYYIWRGQPHRAQALSTSNRTRTTREFSTTDTTLPSDYRMSDMKNGKQEESPLNRN